MQGIPGPLRGPGPGSWWALSALLRLAEQLGQLGLDVDEVGLLAGRHDRVGALEEVGDLLDRRLEVGLAERERTARCSARGRASRPRSRPTARPRRRRGPHGPRCRWTAALARRSTRPAHRARRGTRCGSRTGLPSSSKGSPRVARSSAGERPAEVRVLPIPCCCCSSSVQPQSGAGSRLGGAGLFVVTRPVGDSCEYGALDRQYAWLLPFALVSAARPRGSRQRYPSVSGHRY